jgi:hypothetical protein
MAAQFAGSRSLDERRRRRLATESDEATPEVVPPPAPRRAAIARATATTRGPSHFPLRKMISPRLWKHAGLALLGVLFAAAILVSGWAAETHAGRIGPGLAQLFDLSGARLVRWYLSTMLFLAGELALLIWWLRSQSLQDFNGRYRGWACCAVVALLAAFAIQTDAFDTYHNTIDWMWHVDLRHKQTLIYLVPAILCGLPAWRFLYQEMRDCRLSLAFLSLSIVFGAGLAACAACGPLPLPALTARLVQCGIAMLAAHCLFLSFLFQARYAIYFTVEPPADRAAWFVSLWRRYRRAGEDRRAQKAAAASKDSPAKAPTARRRQRRAEPEPELATDVPMKLSDVPVKILPPAASQTPKKAARVDKRQMRRSA